MAVHQHWSKPIPIKRYGAYGSEERAGQDSEASSGLLMLTSMRRSHAVLLIFCQPTLLEFRRLHTLTLANNSWSSGKRKALISHRANMQTVDRYALRLVRIPPATALGLSYQNLKPYLLRSKPSIPNIIPSLFMMKHLITYHRPDRKYHVEKIIVPTAV